MARKKSPLVKEIDIVYVDISNLKPASYNPRKMPEDSYEKLRGSIEHFGTVDPLIVRRSNNEVIGGHQRLKALTELGWTQAPVVYVDIDDAQAKALNVQLNNPNSQGEWDDEKLIELLQEIEPEISNIEITGFSAAELRELERAAEFDPGDLDDQQRLDEKQKVTCPECGHEFTP